MPPRSSRCVAARFQFAQGHAPSFASSKCSPREVRSSSGRPYYLCVITLGLTRKASFPFSFGVQTRASGGNGIFHAPNFLDNERLCRRRHPLHDFFASNRARPRSPPFARLLCPPRLFPQKLESASGSLPALHYCQRDSSRSLISVVSLREPVQQVLSHFFLILCPQFPSSFSAVPTSKAFSFHSTDFSNVSRRATCNLQGDPHFVRDDAYSLRLLYARRSTLDQSSVPGWPLTP